MKLLGCKRFFDLTFQLFNAIFCYITYDRIEMHLLLQYRFKIGKEQRTRKTERCNATDKKTWVINTF